MQGYWCGKAREKGKDTLLISKDILDELLSTLAKKISHDADTKINS